MKALSESRSFIYLLYDFVAFPLILLERRSSRTNYLVQLLVINVGMGGSAVWWNGRHNRHHAKPNHKGWDLDIRTLPLFAWDKEQATKAPRWLIRYQVGLFLSF